MYYYYGLIGKSCFLALEYHSTTNNSVENLWDMQASCARRGSGFLIHGLMPSGASIDCYLICHMFPRSHSALRGSALPDAALNPSSRNRLIDNAGFFGVSRGSKILAVKRLRFEVISQDIFTTLSPLSSCAYIAGGDTISIALLLSSQCCLWSSSVGRLRLCRPPQRRPGRNGL
jgi:hypothetical protein